MRNKLYNFVGKNPFWVILICLTFTVLSGMGAQKLEFKNDYRVFFSEENPQLTAFESMQKIYAKSDNVSFVVVPKDGNVFTQQHLTALKDLTKASWQVPYSTRVDSVTNFQYTYAEEDDMIVEDLGMSTKGLTRKKLKKLNKSRLANLYLLIKLSLPLAMFQSLM